MNDQFLYEKLDILKEAGINAKLPEIIECGLSSKIVLEIIRKKHLKILLHTMKMII